MEIKINVSDDFDADQPLFTASGDLAGYPEPSEAEYIGTKEAAQMLGKAQITVGQMVRYGRLRGKMIANRWLVEKASVEEMRDEKRR